MNLNIGVINSNLTVMVPFYLFIKSLSEGRRGVRRVFLDRSYLSSSTDLNLHRFAYCKDVSVWASVRASGGVWEDTKRQKPKVGGPTGYTKVRDGNAEARHALDRYRW